MFGFRTVEATRQSLLSGRASTAGMFWLVGVLAFVFWGGPPGHWRATQWLFTYQLGIPRRALPGSLLSLTGDLSYWRITAVSIGLYFVVIGLLGWAFACLAAGDKRRILSVLVLLVSPVGFPFLAANVGRFDTILIILAAVAVSLINRGRLGWVYAVVAVMGLVHEAALVLVVAWLAGLLAYRRNWRHAIGILTVAGAIAGSMMIWTPSVPIDQFSRQLATDFPVVKGSIGVLYSDIAINMHKGLTLLFSAPGARWLLKVLVPSAVVIAVAWSMKNRWLLSGSLAPLMLVLVATDYERWFAFAAGLLVVGLLMHGRRMHTERVLIGLAVTSCVLTLILGGGLVFRISEVFAA